MNASSRARVIPSTTQCSPAMAQGTHPALSFSAVACDVDLTLSWQEPCEDKGNVYGTSAQPWCILGAPQAAKEKKPRLATQRHWGREMVMEAPEFGRRKEQKRAAVPGLAGAERCGAPHVPA